MVAYRLFGPIKIKRFKPLSHKNPSEGAYPGQIDVRLELMDSGSVNDLAEAMFRSGKVYCLFTSHPRDFTPNLAGGLINSYDFRNVLINILQWALNTIKKISCYCIIN